MNLGGNHFIYSVKKRSNMSCPKIALQARFVKTIIEIIILLSMVQVFSLYFLSPQEIGSNIVQLSRRRGVQKTPKARKINGLRVFLSPFQTK
jgi:hypothetical protein